MFDGVTNQQIADEARAAADYLRRNGWVQKALIRSMGQACLRGAVAILRQPFDKTASYMGDYQMCALSDSLLVAIAATLEAPEVERELRLGKMEVDTDFMRTYLTGASRFCVGRWNDAEGRTLDEVLALLETVAQNYSQQEEFILTDKSETVTMHTVVGGLMTANYE